MSHSIILPRLIVTVAACWAVPPLLCHYAGPAFGALGASGAAALWYSQYRFPTWKNNRGTSFWFVVGGYGCIGITLLFCLGRLMGVKLL